MAEAVVILVTVESPEQGMAIARALVQDGLAERVSSIWPVESVVSCEGRALNQTDGVVVIRTVASALDQVVQRVEQLHTSERPEILALGVMGGSRPYLDMLAQHIAASEG